MGADSGRILWTPISSICCLLQLSSPKHVADVVAVHGTYIANTWDFYKPDLSAEYVSDSSNRPDATRRVLKDAH